MKGSTGNKDSNAAMAGQESIAPLADSRPGKGPTARGPIRPPPSMMEQDAENQVVPTTTQSRVTNDDLENEVLDPNADLACAVMVANCSFMTEDDSAFFPVGVEFDPEAKQKAEKRKLQLSYLIAALLLVVAAVVVGATFGLSNTKEDPKSSTYRETLGIRESLERATGLSLATTTVESYQQALDWIIHLDPTEPMPEDSNLVQRFIAASIYYGTSLDHDWAFCTPPTPYSGVACTFQMANRVYTDFSFAIEGNRWLSSSHECTWAGLRCDAEDRIVDVKLSKYHG